MSVKQAPATANGGAKKPNTTRTFVLFLLIAAATGSACYVLRGRPAFEASIADTWSQLVSLLVELGLGLVIASAVGILVPKNKVSRWLGAESGFSGLVTASALGMITPGGPYASFPLVLSLAKAGADMGALIAFLTAWAASSASRLLIWEIPMLGFDFAMLRFVVSIPLPLLAGLAARAIAARYPLAGER